MKVEQVALSNTKYYNFITDTATRGLHLMYVMVMIFRWSKAYHFCILFPSEKTVILKQNFRKRKACRNYE